MSGGVLPERLPPLPARGILGICGAPGVGKTTLAARLAAELACPVVPMDGFHLADVELRRRGLLGRKGAPETFDAAGYAALLARIRVAEEEIVMAPAFERELEQPIAGALPIRTGGLVITEGNYLLLDTPEWHAVRAQVDEVWHLTLDDEVRVARLVERHIAFGKSPRAARAWVDEVDEPNARLVEAAGPRADHVIRL